MASAPLNDNSRLSALEWSVVAFAQRYDKKAGIGTIMATMLPYSLTFFILWTLLLIVWYLLGLPLGPGAGIYYNPVVAP